MATILTFQREQRCCSFNCGENKVFESDEDPSSVEFLFKFGRYLLFSSSRPGTQVADFQGIWNKDLDPACEYILHSPIFFIFHPPLPLLLLFFHLYKRRKLVFEGKIWGDRD